MSVPLRVVPSSTLSSNRCLGIGFLSRADREITVFRHVAPPLRLRLEFPRETASSEVRGEGREPLADKAGELTLLRDQEGKRGSDEVVPGTLVFPSSATRMSGNFWGSIKGAKYHFALEDRTWDYS